MADGSNNFYLGGADGEAMRTEQDRRAEYERRLSEALATTAGQTNSTLFPVFLLEHDGLGVRDPETAAAAKAAYRPVMGEWMVNEDRAMPEMDIGAGVASLVNKTGFLKMEKIERDGHGDRHSPAGDNLTPGETPGSGKSTGGPGGFYLG